MRGEGDEDGVDAARVDLRTHRDRQRDLVGTRETTARSARALGVSSHRPERHGELRARRVNPAELARR